MRTAIVLGAGEFPNRVVEEHRHAPRNDEILLIPWRSAALQFQDAPNVRTPPISLRSIENFISELRALNVEALCFVGRVSQGNDLRNLGILFKDMKNTRSFSAINKCKTIADHFDRASLPIRSISEIFPIFALRNFEECDFQMSELLEKARHEAAKLSRVHFVESAVINCNGEFSFEGGEGTDALLDRERDLRSGQPKMFAKFALNHIKSIACPVVGSTTLIKCREANINKVFLDANIAVADPERFSESTAELDIKLIMKR